jgi:hypothetical protein
MRAALDRAGRVEQPQAVRGFKRVVLGLGGRPAGRRSIEPMASTSTEGRMEIGTAPTGFIGAM